VPPPPVFVERTVSNDATVSPGALNGLGPGHADAEIHYTAVDLGAAEKTRFKYRLDGYDADWIEAGTRRIAYYTQIPPGHYRFEVVATDSNGAWSGKSAAVSLAVVPFWWQRREVQGAALAVLLVASGYVVRVLSLRRARARVAELEREQAVERERSRIARDLHDDLGSRLAQIALIAEAEGVSHTTTQISGVAREAMQTMDELVWTVNARNDTVDSFAEFAAEFAEQHLRLAGIRYRLQFGTDFDGRRLAADTRRHLYLAFKEAIHNVVKHAHASEVHVGLAIDRDTLVLDVADNGRGLPDDQIGGTGNGLRNLRERMDAIGGALGIESTTGAGTRLVFRAPLSSDAVATG
jgi:signal transduction histidine kinase